jgi:hypothetical protein
MAEIADWNPRSVQRNVTGQTVDEWQKRLELAQKAGIGLDYGIGIWSTAT